MKKLSKILFIVVICFLTVSLSSCKSSGEDGSENFEEQQYENEDLEGILYLYAIENGYNYSETIWRNNISSFVIKFRMVDDDIEWTSSEVKVWCALYTYDGTENDWYNEFVEMNTVHYTQFYTVSFESNCDTKIDSQIIEKGTSISAIEIPRYNEYSFNGLFYKDTNNEFILDETLITNTTTLELKWDIIDIIFNDFDLIDGYYYLEVDNDNLTLDLSDYVTYDYDWYISSNIDSDQTVSLNIGINTYYLIVNQESSIDHIFELKIKRLDMYDVTFKYYIDGVFYIDESRQYQENTFINIDLLDKEGVTISDYFDINILIDDSKEVNVYYISNTYQLSFDVNGGDELDNSVANVTYGYYTVLMVPTKFGYEFLGWSYDNEIVDNNFKYIYSFNITLKAVWKEYDYTITYELEGGVNNPLNVSGFYDNETIKLIYDASKDGYEFLGWYIDDIKIESGVWNFNEDITLTSKWILIYHNIYYLLSDGVNNLNNPQNISIETEFTLQEPTRDYYIFVGWNVDGIFYESYTIYKPTNYMIVTAIWEVIQYSIEYQLNGGSLTVPNPTEYLVSDGTISLNFGYKSGFVFSVWYLLDVENNITNITTLNKNLFDKTISSSITLYAVYTNDASNVIFEDVDHNGTLYNYIYFGKYPQTVVSNSDLITELDKLSEVNENGYYEYEGIEYAKQVANLYYTSSSIFNNGVSAVNNKSYYFKVEPIKWRILVNEEGSIKVMSEYILDQSKYRASSSFSSYSDSLY